MMLRAMEIFKTTLFIVFMYIYYSLYHRKSNPYLFPLECHGIILVGRDLRSSLAQPPDQHRASYEVRVGDSRFLSTFVLKTSRMEMTEHFWETCSNA